MKDTTAIVFNGGSYGTYLEWCLTALTNNNNLQEPFTILGNSHKFIGNHLLNIEGWRKYVADDVQYPFVRLHPKTKVDQRISDILLEILQDAKKFVYVYPDESTSLLGLNNYFYKIWESWVNKQFGTTIDPRKIYNNWPVSEDTPINQIPNWIMREFLSYYLMPAWLDQIEWSTRLSHNYPNMLTVKVSDLLFDFENTLLNIQQFCKLSYCRPVTDLNEFHKKNLELQKYIEHDCICNSIIESVLSKTELEWPELSLPSEVWIQWELRNRGIEIRCDGLDTFPTNSLQLRELLYPV